jgi:hypothetical protein
MHLRAQPISLLDGMLGDIGRLLLGNMKQLLNPPAESREVCLRGPCIGLVERLAELIVAGSQCVVLLQQLSDLGLRRAYKMIND